MAYAKDKLFLWIFDEMIMRIQKLPLFFLLDYALSPNLVINPYAICDSTAVGRKDASILSTPTCAVTRSIIR
jgi:hypothetical protein